MTESQELHPLVQAIAKSFQLDEGQLVMGAEAANGHMKALIALKPGDRELVAQHLVALALRFREKGADSVEGALALLIGFVVAAVGDDQAKASDMFGKAGLASEAAAVIGRTEGTKAPRAELNAPAAPAVKAKRGLKRE
jgi:hypothetical protein